MDFMVDRKEFDKALRLILQGRNAHGPDVVDFTASRETLAVVVTGRSVAIAIEAAEIGSVSLPIEVVAKLKRIAKTYENERLRLRAGEGRVRLEGTSISREDIHMKEIAHRVIDIPEDARPMDLLSLRQIFTFVEIEECHLSGKVLEAEKKLADALDSAADWLADYGISRDELKVMAEARIRENAPSLRKAIFQADEQTANAAQEGEMQPAQPSASMTYDQWIQSTADAANPQAKDQSAPLKDLHQRIVEQRCEQMNQKHKENPNYRVPY